MSQSVRTAADAGIKFLYHYQKFNPAHLTTILRDKKIYCSDPSSMNDPWDFRPAFDWQPMMIDTGNLKRMFDTFRIAASPEILNHPLLPVFEQNVRADEKALRRLMDSASEILSRELCIRRIYCLTPLPDSILMWSHYARNHSGVCLEFNVGNNPLFAMAMKVRYCDTYPVFTPQDAGLDAISIILTKAVDWAYEDEYRVVASPKLPGTALHLQGEYVPLPDGALSAVIIGCKARRENIVNLVRKYAPKLPIKYVQRVANKYKLEIV
jgi:hypothetical protein